MNNRVCGAAWILVCGSLLACSDEPAPAPEPAAAPASAAAPVSADFVAAVPVGEPVASLAVSFRMTEQPRPGEATSLVLAIVSTEALESLQVSGMSPDIAVETDGAALAVAPVEAGRRYELPVTIRARETGLTDLTLEVTTQAGDARAVARFAVPVLAQAAASEG